MAKQPRDSTPVEVAYSAWLRAAREAAGSGAAVVREMQTHLERHGLLGDLPFKWQPEAKYSIERKDRHWHSTAFRQWEKGRKSSPVPGVPDEDVLRDALVAVVSGLVDRVPADAAGWATFRSVFDALLDERELSRQDSGISARARGQAEREHRDRNILAADPGAAKNLDPLALGLGSWVLDGDLPNYIPRTPDRLLAEQLTGGAGVTVVVGPPKSGKSRSVLQVLQDRVPAAWVWWVNPAPGVLPELVTRTERAGTGDQAPEVIVLDDAHLHGVNPTDGLTHARLTKLARTARVVVIVHEADLAAWQRQARDRSPDPDRRMAGIGATVELVDLLTAHRIDYPPVLDDTELATAAAEYDRADHHLDGLDLTRMAEVFASVAQLEDKARSAQAEGGMNAALVEAAIDATIAFPAGTGRKWLKKLTRIHFRREEPNKDWDTERFERAFDWATTGLAPRSPHAILIRSGLGNEGFRLLDSLTQRLTDVTRDLRHFEDLDLPATAMFYVGVWFYQVRDPAQALPWMEKVAKLGPSAAPEARFALTIQFNEAGDVDWFRVTESYPDAGKQLRRSKEED